MHASAKARGLAASIAGFDADAGQGQRAAGLRHDAAAHWIPVLSVDFLRQQRVEPLRGNRDPRAGIEAPTLLETHVESKEARHPPTLHVRPWLTRSRIAGTAVGSRTGHDIRPTRCVVAAPAEAKAATQIVAEHGRDDVRSIEAR